MKKLQLLVIFALLITWRAYSQCSDVTLTTQSEVDDFNCDLVTGDLIITDVGTEDTIKTLSRLRLSGPSDINGSLVIKNCNFIESLEGLDRISNIGGSLIVEDNLGLTSIDRDGGNGFRLKRIDGNFVFRNNPGLSEVNAFNLLDSIGNDIEISNLNSLHSISLLGQINYVNELRIEKNLTLQGPIIFSQLLSIRDSFVLADNLAMTNCCWINDIVEVTEENKFRIENNGIECIYTIDTSTTGSMLNLNCMADSIIVNNSDQCDGTFEFLIPQMDNPCSLEEYNLRVYDDGGIESHQFNVITEEEILIDDLPIGINILELSARNYLDSTATCTFQVEVKDTQFPRFSNELKEDTVPLLGTDCLARYSVEFPEVIENCNIQNSQLYIVDLSSTDTIYKTDAFSGGSYNIDLESGQYLVGAIVTDHSNLTDLSTATLYIPPKEEFIITGCFRDTILTAQIGCQVDFSFSAPEVFGNCRSFDQKMLILSQGLDTIASQVVNSGESFSKIFPAGVSTLSFNTIEDSVSFGCTMLVHVVPPDTFVAMLNTDTLFCDQLDTEITAEIDTTGISFSWEGPQEFSSQELIDEVSSPGIYRFIIKDSLGCLHIQEAEVVTGNLEVDIDIVPAEIDCEAGARRLRLTDELENYQFTWMGPHGFISTNNSPFISDAGNYKVVVENSFGCFGSDSIEILNDLDYNYEIKIDGTDAEIIISGGTPPFSFTWDNEQVGSRATNLEPGIHTLRIVDGLGCIRTISFEVVTTSVIDATSLIQVYPNPFTDVLNLSLMGKKSYQIVNIGGTIVKQGTIDHQEKLEVGDLAKGVYFLKIKGQNIRKLIKY